jgi:tRNA(fMet)-specific endonuclease VapC
MRYLLDTNVLSDLVRRPEGPVSEHVRRVGENAVMTSIIVAAELRFGAAKRGSKSLAAQLEAILGALEVVPLEPPADEAYAAIRTELEARGAPIGGNDVLIAAHARALGTTLVTDNEREFRRVDGLTIENWLR